jgi:uncharacterized protein YcfJ
MKRLLLISTLASISLLLANNALADRDHHHHKRHHDRHHHHTTVHHERVVVYERDYYAPVTDVRPIYREVAVDVPRDSCRVETVEYRERQRGGDSFKGTVVGGLIGAAIGKEMGNSGHATAAGGLIGAAIGNDVAGGGRTVTRYEDREVCSTQYRTRYERQLVGYEVSYLYGGRIYHTETRHHPGDRIRHR